VALNSKCCSLFGAGSPRKTFVQLLEAAAILPNEKVVSFIRENMASQLFAVVDGNTPVGALRLYEKASAVPASSTRIRLDAELQIAIDGVLPTNVPTSSVFVRAFEDGHLRVIKIPPDAESAEAEVCVWAALAQHNTHSQVPRGLVGPLKLVDLGERSTIEFKHGERTAKRGVLMPFYGCTLHDVSVFNCSSRCCMPSRSMGG
jgi:hypothetical protein